VCLIQKGKGEVGKGGEALEASDYRNAAVVATTEAPRRGLKGR